MEKKLVSVNDSVGKVICHDITYINENFKGPLFKKGHVIKAQDIEKLLLAGKEHIYILELEADELHEDTASMSLAKGAAGKGIKLTGPQESRVNLLAEYTGLLKVQTEQLKRLNALDNIIFATLPTDRVVQVGEKVAGTKVVPLAVKDSLIKEAEQILCEGSLIEIKPFISKSVGMIITGNEIYKKRIEDAFEAVVKEKLKIFGSELITTVYAPDDSSFIAKQIKAQIDSGVELVIVTGGMSVDPDDVTPLSIASTGAKIIKYGAPVLPGAMFLMSYLGDVPVLGVPACGMFFKITILDILLPRILAGEKITKEDIINLAHGGLCSSCETCHYPKCSFGISGG